jgi:capsular polysaccharide biosynthesis protein
LTRKVTRREAQLAAPELTIDLGLYIGVLRRHRLLVACGCALALALALLSYVRVSGDGLSYRNPETWSNEATLLLSDSSQPQWRSKLPPTVDPNRFTSLVDQYAALATSDAVIRSLQRQGLLSSRAEGGKLAAVAATAVPSPTNGATTPLLKITGSATSPAEATLLTLRATDTFIAVARARQVNAKIPEDQRVVLRIVNRSGVPKLTAPRSKTTFIIILLAGLTATIAAAFVRDNMQRAQRTEDQPEPVAVLDSPVREVEVPSHFVSENTRAAGQGARSPLNEVDGMPEGGSVTRWSKRSSG